MPVESVRYKFGDSYVTVSELAKRYSITKAAIYRRLHKGWTKEDFDRGYIPKPLKVEDSDKDYKTKWLRVRMHCNQHPGYMCEEWYNNFESFKAFLKAINWNWSIKIYRRDNSKPLSWNNYSVNTYGGRKLYFGKYTINELASKYKITRQAVRGRISYGWTLEDFEHGSKIDSKHPRVPLVEEYASKYNISKTKAKARLQAGWTPEDFERGYRYYARLPKVAGGYNIKELSLKYKIKRSTCQSRIRNGWTLEDFERGYKKGSKYGRSLCVTESLETKVSFLLQEKKPLFESLLEHVLSTYNLKNNKGLSISETRHPLLDTEYIDYYIEGKDFKHHILRMEIPLEKSCI